MKALFFHAAAEHRKVAWPLQEHVDGTLRPFDHYLRQAIDAAKSRQFRYKLRWRLVQDLRPLQLDALDTRLAVPRPAPGWIVTNWPVGKVPEVGRPLMVLNRDCPITLDSCEPGPLGFVIHPAGALHEGDQVFWCGVQCALTREPQAPTPREVQDASGAVHRVLHAEDHDERTWILRVDARLEAGALRVHGRTVTAERLADLDGARRLYDESGRGFDVTGGQLKVEELPAGEILQADTGVRFRWRERGAGGRGAWVQLLLPDEVAAEDFLDPRAAFCEDDVEAVWTDARHREADVIKVRRIDRERYQLLLERVPPAGAELHLPVDVRNLELQRRALRQLREAPLPHQRGLLRLCEDPAKVRWPAIQPAALTTWSFLTSVERDGTAEQRRFVERALGAPAPDLTLLEGPPGSGKTTAICELIRHCIARGERVLLCASTHAAIDNVLERLLEEPGTPLEALRIGLRARVDDKVDSCHLDAKVDRLLEAWRGSSAHRGLGDAELRDMAERTVVMAANLTCSITTGIMHHPLLRGRDDGGGARPWERPIATQPFWHVLVVDEASKTSIQEFMVPALLARRWVIVGDVRQLPPFTDRADILANLRSLTDPGGAEVFPPDHQRARLLLFRLASSRRRRPRLRWLLVEPPGVIAAVAKEIHAIDGDLDAVQVVLKRSTAPGAVAEITLDEIRAGDAAALRLAAAEWVLVESALFHEVAVHLPANLLAARELIHGEEALAEDHPLPFRMEAFLARAAPFAQPVRERGKGLATFAELQRHEQEWLARHDWAQEVAWRMTRAHELRRSRSPDERDRLHRGIDHLLPATADIAERIAEIQDVGLPSIIEVLQEGIGEQRTNRPSALTEGLPLRQPIAFEQRFESLSYQHRMHPEIASFARDTFYRGRALKDANTIAVRDGSIGWDFAPELGARRVWVDVDGRESGGINAGEIEVMAAIVRAFQAWAAVKGPPCRERPRAWELACLCFYVKQEAAVRAMLKEVTAERDRETRFASVNLEIVCGTVDRFQGREADMVILSMRNTGRTGFLDSPNRLNVALTRARQQLVILGRADYFAGCRTPELEDLVRQTRLVKPRSWPGVAARADTGRGGRRGAR
ncbi:AAA domain-containing protein [Sorangium sp. So ce388]|uniref:AAA domain-containing protein n=1 Tax=Sorangium sp. So ce388 TaxID=3133309 RepID=UPI003F5C2140